MSNSLPPRDRILMAAERLFREQGYLGTRLSHIARDADLRSGNIQRYFPGKKEIACTITRKNTTKLEVYLNELDDRIPDPFQRLTECLHDNLWECDRWYNEGDFTMRLLNDVTTETASETADHGDVFTQFYLTYLRWIKKTLEEIGTEDPHKTAFELYAGLMGAVHLGRTIKSLKDTKDYIQTQVTNLEHTIKIKKDSST